MSKSYGSTVWRCDACNEDVSSLVVTIPTITDEQAEILILRAKLKAAEERIADFHRTFAGHVYIKNEDLAAKCVLSREAMARAEAAEAAASRYCTLVDQYRSRAKAAEAEVEDAQRLSKIADDHIGMLQAEVARMKKERDQWKETFDRAMDDESSLREQLREMKSENERLQEDTEELIKDYAEWMSPEDYVENTQRYEAQVKFLQAENAALLAYPYKQMMARIRRTATEAALGYSYDELSDCRNSFGRKSFVDTGIKALLGEDGDA